MKNILLLDNKMEGIWLEKFARRSKTRLVTVMNESLTNVAEYFDEFWNRISGHVKLYVEQNIKYRKMFYGSLPQILGSDMESILRGIKTKLFERFIKTHTMAMSPIQYHGIYALLKTIANDIVRDFFETKKINTENTTSNATSNPTFQGVQLTRNLGDNNELPLKDIYEDFFNNALTFNEITVKYKVKTRQLQYLYDYLQNNGKNVSDKL
jgi:hypothetical protein